MNLGMGGVPKRSGFIIDKNGVIQYVESNDDARLPNFEKIKETGRIEMMCALTVVIPSHGGEGPLSHPFDHSEYCVPLRVCGRSCFAQDDGTEYGRRI
jgi:hypothetical protein